MTIKGRIIKGIGGFYYVEAAGALYECRGSGSLRNRSITPLVGDMCEIDTIDDSTAYVTDIVDRRVALRRPAVANVDRVMVIFSVDKPQLHPGLLDRFLINMSVQDMETYILLSKIDTGKPYEDIVRVYEGAGYRVLPFSSKTGDGVDEIRAVMQHSVSVLSGPSGVGKSSLLNVLCPDAYMETGDISHKIGRGKNTTRHGELFRMDDDTYVIDTPGFSSVELLVEDEQELDMHYIEFRDYIGHCRFTGCAHISEPECAVKQALDDGRISHERYDSYVRLRSLLSETGGARQEARRMYIQKAENKNKNKKSGKRTGRK